MAKTTTNSGRTPAKQEPQKAGAQPKRENEDSGEPTRARYDVSPEEFCRVWESCETIDEVVEILKMPKGVISARAAGYRNSGVRLKKMKRPPTGRGLDIQNLNQMIAEMHKKKQKAGSAKPPAVSKTRTESYEGEDEGEGEPQSTDLKDGDAIRAALDSVIKDMRS